VSHCRPRVGRPILIGNIGIDQAVFVSPNSAGPHSILDRLKVAAAVTSVFTHFH
jgi:hypothetical protein